MNDVDGRLRHLGEGNGPAGCFGLGAHRSGQGVPLGLGVPLGKGPLDQRVDHPTVLGVHANQRPVLPRTEQGTEDGGVIDHEESRVGHEQLEAGDAFPGEGVHFLEVAWLELANDGVK